MAEFEKYCHSCSSFFLNDAAIRAHNDSLHSKLQEKKKHRKCHVCGTLFASHALLCDHVLLFPRKSCVSRMKSTLHPPQEPRATEDGELSN